MPKSIILMEPSGQQHDVLGLDVPVDDALGMGMLQGTQNLGGEMDGFLPCQGSAALLEVFLQRDAVDIFHDDILHLVRDRDVVHLDNVGMVKDRDRFGLIFEASDQLFIIEKFLFQHLDRHRVAGLGILATIDVCHTAHTDQALDQIAAVQLFADQIIHLSPPLIPRPSAAR